MLRPNWSRSGAVTSPPPRRRASDPPTRACRRRTAPSSTSGTRRLSSSITNRDAAYAASRCACDDGDPDAHLAKHQFPHTVLDHDLLRVEPLRGFRDDALQLQLRHRVVGPVLDAGHGAPVIHVAHGAQEEDDRAMRDVPTSSTRRSRIDGRVTTATCARSASRHGRDHRQLIARRERRVAERVRHVLIATSGAAGDRAPPGNRAQRSSTSRTVAPAWQGEFHAGSAERVGIGSEEQRGDSHGRTLKIAQGRRIKGRSREPGNANAPRRVNRSGAQTATLRSDARLRLVIVLECGHARPPSRAAPSTA